MTHVLAFPEAEMLKWIKVRQDSAATSAAAAECKARGDEGEDSGMEREEPPGMDLNQLKKV